MRSFFIFLLLCTFHAPLPVAAKALDTSVFCVPGNRQSYTPIHERLEKGLLFRIEHCAYAPSHILGTLHTDDPAIIAQSHMAFARLRTSHTALFEVVLDAKNQKTIIQHMLLPQQQQGLEALLGTEQFAILTQGIQEAHKDFPAVVLNRYRPWAAAVLLQFPPRVADGIVLDDKLQNEAISARIPVVGLETVDEQFAAFESMSDAEQLTMLRDTLAHMDNIAQGNATLFALYKAHDLKGIGALGDKAFTEISDPDLRERMKDQIITQRNARMAEGMLTYLPEGNQFIAVGALHLPGAEGILARLEKRGYFITVVE